MRNYIEIWFWQIARNIIEKGYGNGCETSDLDDFKDDWVKHCKSLGEAVISKGRCASCRAKEVIVWIDEHIELLKFYA
ncbi:MAG: hypothetical protein WC917_00220 [Bacilli bacterium]|jgi:hypothetical protein